MANIKSQIKRNKQNDKKRLTNRVYRGEARIAVKEARIAIQAGAPESKEELSQAVSALDKAAEKGVLHKNNAARRKSRLMKAFNAMKPAEVKAPVVEPLPVPAAEVEAKPRRTKAEPKAAKKAEPKAAKKAAPKAAKKAAPKAAKKAEPKAPKAEKKAAVKKTPAKE